MRPHGPTGWAVPALFWPHRRPLLLASALTVVACVLHLTGPVALRQVVDGVAAGQPPPLVRYAVGLTAGHVALAAAGWAAAVLVGGVGAAVAVGLRCHAYARLMEAGQPAAVPAGTVLSRLTDDVAAVQGLASAQTVAAVTELGTAAVAAGSLLWVSPTLFAVAAVLTAGYFGVGRRFTQRIRAGANAVRGRLDAVFADFKEKLDGAVVVRTHGRAADEERAFADRLAAAHARRVALGGTSAAFAAVGQAFAGLGPLAVFVAGVWAAGRGLLTPGEVGAASALAALVFGPAARLGAVAEGYQQAAVSADRLAALTTAVPGPADPVNPVPLGRAVGRIEFDRVWFGYHPDRPVLDGLKLRIEPGTTVAVVGPTGCGKSTLLSLLLRFHDPAAGAVTLDGTPLDRFALADLRRQFGWVPQDPALLTGTLADAVRFGCPDAPPERVRAVAQAVGLDAVAARLPAGFATVVGPGGHPLSPGERQLVAIARALCPDPPVVLLDEATSGLDPAAEARVQAALGALLRGRTAVVVAHRLATVRAADLVAVLDAGRVVRLGPPGEVLP